MKLLITNVVYGDTYANIFLNYHLKSLLDPTNLPAMNKDIEYVIFTDVDTEPILRKHPNMIKLLSMCEVTIRDFTWRPDARRFEMRYNLLVETFRQSVQLALEKNCLLSALVADTIVSQGFLPRVMAYMIAGHDAVLLHPARGAAEAMIPDLDKAEGALTADDLWKLCHQNLHPYLSLIAHYDSPTFTKYPFYLLWNTGTGMMARSFSLTPVIFKPTEPMILTKKVIDIEIPGMFTNPYICLDYDDAGVVWCEPTLCYNKAASNFPASIEKLQNFAKDRDPSQLKHLRHRFYFPNQLVANVNSSMLAQSDIVVNAILGNGG